MRKIVQKAMLLLIAAVLAVSSANAQAVGDKFKEGSLYYKIANISPKEVAVATQKNTNAYWNNTDEPCVTSEFTDDEGKEQNAKFRTKHYTLTITSLIMNRAIQIITAVADNVPALLSNGANYFILRKTSK